MSPSWPRPPNAVGSRRGGGMGPVEYFPFMPCPLFVAWKRIARMKTGRTLFAFLCLAGAAQPASAFQLQTAVLAGGCYWGVESVYEHVKGVRDVVSGYAGGNRSGLTR